MCCKVSYMQLLCKPLLQFHYQRAGQLGPTIEIIIMVIITHLFKSISDAVALQSPPPTGSYNWNYHHGDWSLVLQFHCQRAGQLVKLTGSHNWNYYHGDHWSCVEKYLRCSCFAKPLLQFHRQLWCPTTKGPTVEMIIMVTIRHIFEMIIMVIIKSICAEVLQGPPISVSPPTAFNLHNTLSCMDCYAIAIGHA